MYPATITSDGTGFWHVSSDIGLLEISVSDPLEIIEVAVTTGWTPCPCGALQCSHRPLQNQLAEANRVLAENDGWEFDMLLTPRLSERAF